MSETRSQKRDRSEAAQRKRVVRITRKVSSTLGSDFFQSLVKHMADALRADCVYIAELLHGPSARIGTLAVCLNGEWAENFEQDLPGAASEHVVAEGNVAYNVNVTELFPLDPVLERLRAQAFAGYRLSDSAGQVLGILAAVYSHPPADMELARSVLEAFLPRAAAELARKRDHDGLRRADERHRAFIATSADAMWRIEFEHPIPVELDEQEQIERIYRYGYVAECNAAFARLAGAPSGEELVGTRFAAMVATNNERLCEELRLLVRSGYRDTVVETTPLDPLGRRMYRLRSTFGIVKDGELLRIWGTTRDITELRRAEQALVASERRSHEMIERLQLPAVVMDSAGQILFANDALLRLGRWSKEELADRNWFDLLADRESGHRWKAALLYSGSGPAFAHFASAVRCAEGITRLISWNTALLLDADGEVDGIAAIGTDITGQAAIEAQIRQAQKLEGIGRMAAGVAHDFNNLLAVVLGHTSQLLDQVNGNNTFRESLLAIRASAMQCAGLTQQLLAVGQKQRLQPVILNLNRTISSAEAVVRGLVGERIALHLQLDPSLRSINADPAQMERVLTNLSANARDAMPNGGKLVFATANVDLDETAVSGTPGLKPGPFVKLTVTDTGVGMSEEVRSRIFEPFFTTKPSGEGTGLGLSTVCGIVGQSGGSISVSSEPGKGASFEILLPAAEAPAKP